MRFVFTGVAKVDGEHFTRCLLEEVAQSKGHSVQGKVDCLTDYLVTSVWPPKRVTRKAQAAMDNGTKVLRPDEFLAMMRHG